MNVHSSDHPERELAERLVQELAAVPQPSLALSGGSTPRALFKLFVDRYRDAIDWHEVTIFQVDERAVPPDHMDSNWLMIREELLSEAPAGNAFRMRAERKGAAEDYEKIIRKNTAPDDNGIPRIDAIVLGMGKDGHTASLFPGSPALKETEKLVVRTEEPTLGSERVTMTLPLINAARHKFFLVRGQDKAAAFRDTEEGTTPASRVTDAEWYVDPAVIS